MRQSATKQLGNSHPQRSVDHGRASRRKKTAQPPLAKKRRRKSAPPPEPVLRLAFSLPSPSSQRRSESVWVERLSIEEPACISLGTPTMPWTGSRRLLLGVLQDALRSFFQYRSDHTRQGRLRFTETQAWIWSSEQDWLYSFENICAHLHLDPGYIREGLQRFLQTTRSTAMTPRRSTRSSHRRPFRLVSGPGTRIPRRTHDSVRLQNIK